MRKFFYFLFISLVFATCTATVTQANTIMKIHDAVFSASEKYDVDPLLILAVIEVESKFNPKAVGGVGEIGLMQLNPRFFPNASFDIRKNILQGTRYLSLVRDQCPNKSGLTWINCYNIGTGRALNHPTKFAYYKKIMTAYRKYKALAHE